MAGVLDLTQDVVTTCQWFPAAHNVSEQVSGHVLPQEAIDLGVLTQEQYDEYQHFTIVRNPIDRWISAYAWFCRTNVTEKTSPLS